MIRFEGDLSPECKKFMLKRERRISSLVVWVASLLYSIPVILATIFFASYLRLIFALHSSFCTVFIPAY